VQGLATLLQDDDRGTLNVRTGTVHYGIGGTAQALWSIVEPVRMSKDGYKSELKVMNVADLLRETVLLFQSYNMGNHLQMMSALQNSFMSESAFAQFLGKSRMYQFLPQKVKKSLPQMLMTDTQIGLEARAYYNDENFAPQQGAKEISMWNVYNLLTGANKSSYIDNFLDRSHNASLLADGLNRALYGENEYSWFIQ